MMFFTALLGFIVTAGASAYPSHALSLSLSHYPYSLWKFSKALSSWCRVTLMAFRYVRQWKMPYKPYNMRALMTTRRVAIQFMR
jgi:hypothetical protein